VRAVVCVSQHDREVFARIVPSQRLRTIENGANIDRFWSLDKKLEPGLLLGVSRLAENKRIEKVLQAMALLKERYPALRLEWIGADFAGLRTTLERRVAELGLRGRVCFRGAVSDHELSSALARAHLFVSASSYEGFGLSTIEAMSAATVVVVTAVGAHADVVQDGVNGFLVDKEASRLTNTIAGALRLPPDKLTAIGAAARTAAQRFSWTQIAPLYEQLYRDVLATSGKGEVRPQ
jgi:alpha-1,3-mannosyltransferase